jgi:hypothetical protein
MQPYLCRNVPLVHFWTSILLIPGYHINFHRHVTPISRYQIFLAHPHQGTKFPNPHTFILVTFLVVAITILPPHHHSNRHNQSLLPLFSFFFEPLVTVNQPCIVLMNPRLIKASSLTTFFLIPLFHCSALLAITNLLPLHCSNHPCQSLLPWWHGSQHLVSMA